MQRAFGRSRICRCIRLFRGWAATETIRAVGFLNRFSVFALSYFVFCRSPRFEVDSSLPENPTDFQRNRDTVAVRYHSRRIVRRWTGRRHSRAVNVAVRRCAVANALHLLPHGSTAHDAVGIKLYPHRLRVEVIRDRPRTSNTCCSPRVSTFTSPKCSAAHFCSRLCCQSTICLPTAPLFAARSR